MRSIQMIPQYLCICYVQERNYQMIGKNIKNCSHKDNVGFLESSLIFFRAISLRHASADQEHFYGLQPERGLDLQPFKVRTKIFFSVTAAKSAIVNLGKRPTIKFLDC
jgi:hypothetical protein